MGFLSLALPKSGWSAPRPHRFTSTGTGDQATHWAGCSVGLKTSRHVFKRHKAWPLPAIDAEFNSVSTNFAYPCVTELRSILSSLPWPANRKGCYITTERTADKVTGSECSWRGPLQSVQLGSDWRSEGTRYHNIREELHKLLKYRMLHLSRPRQFRTLSL